MGGLRNFYIFFIVIAVLWAGAANAQPVEMIKDQVLLYPLAESDDPASSYDSDDQQVVSKLSLSNLTVEKIGSVFLIKQKITAKGDAPTSSAGSSIVPYSEENNLCNKIKINGYGCEPDFVVRLTEATTSFPESAPKDPLYSTLKKQFDLIKLKPGPNEAWAMTQGKSQLVAVLDSGIDYNNPDIKGNMWTNSREIPGNKIDDDKNGYVDDFYGYDVINEDGDPMDEYYHGTHCAGTIGAIADNRVGALGVAPKVKLMAVKIFNENTTSVSNAIKGISYAIKMGARTFNLSWGGYFESETLLKTLKDAKTTVFIASAGNFGENNDVNPFYPASYKIDNIISVFASTLDGKKVAISNYGKTTVHVGAPGADINGAVLNNGYEKLTGTSMAAPFATGLAVLMKTMNPNLTPAQIKSKMIFSGSAYASLKTYSVAGTILNALKTLDNSKPPPVVATPTRTPTRTPTKTSTSTATATITPLETPVDTPTETPTEIPSMNTPTSLPTPVSTDKPNLGRALGVSYSKKSKQVRISVSAGPEAKLKLVVNHKACKTLIPVLSAPRKFKIKDSSQQIRTVRASLYNGIQLIATNDLSLRQRKGKLPFKPEFCKVR